MATINRATMFCVCGHSHDVHNMSTGGSTNCNVQGCSCTRWGLDDMSFAREPQSIPVIDERTAALVALFDAALAAKPWDVVLSEVSQPGAGDALIAWARSRGIPVTERHFVTETRSYANVRVNLAGSNSERGDSTLTVLGYRALTDAEIAAIKVETHERGPERIGYGGGPL